MMTIELAEDKQAAFNATAQAHGLSAEDYARQVLESAIEGVTKPPKDIEELFAPLRGLNLDFSGNPSTGRPVEL
jgi:plasmid stability protein